MVQGTVHGIALQGALHGALHVVHCIVHCIGVLTLTLTCAAPMGMRNWKPACAIPLPSLRMQAP